MPSKCERLTKQGFRCSSRSNIGAESIPSREWPDIVLEVVRDDRKESLEAVRYRACQSLWTKHLPPVVMGTSKYSPG